MNVVRHHDKRVELIDPLIAMVNGGRLPWRRHWVFGGKSSAKASRPIGNRPQVYNLPYISQQISTTCALPFCNYFGKCSFAATSGTN